jgi:hypothetical protein
MQHEDRAEQQHPTGNMPAVMLAGTAYAQDSLNMADMHRQAHTHAHAQVHIQGRPQPSRAGPRTAGNRITNAAAPAAQQHQPPWSWGRVIVMSGYTPCRVT